MWQIGDIYGGGGGGGGVVANTRMSVAMGWPALSGMGGKGRGRLGEPGCLLGAGCIGGTGGYRGMWCRRIIQPGHMRGHAVSSNNTAWVYRGAGDWGAYRGVRCQWPEVTRRLHGGVIVLSRG